MGINPKWSKEERKAMYLKFRAMAAEGKLHREIQEKLKCSHHSLWMIRTEFNDPTLQKSKRPKWSVSAPLKKISNDKPVKPAKYPKNFIKNLDTFLEKYERECKELISRIHAAHGAPRPPDNFYIASLGEAGIKTLRGGI